MEAISPMVLLHVNLVGEHTATHHSSHLHCDVSAVSPRSFAMVSDTLVKGRRTAHAARSSYWRHVDDNRALSTKLDSPGVEDKRFQPEVK